MENINAIKEAARWCLNCPNRSCSTAGCPIKTDIPGFINEIKNDNIKEAYDILINNNILSHICSIVCPQEEQCEGNCVRGIKQHPVEIGRLEKFVNEWAEEKNYKAKIECDAPNGKKVAIVGAGPAGLSCAIELLKKGFEITIYEKEKRAGGILEYGIPDFRLEKKYVDDVERLVESLGAVFEFEKELGKDIFLSDLSKEYDAVFLGLGAEKSSTYSLTDEEIKEGIFKSDEFLKTYNIGGSYDNLGTVAVIGGGNVAMDSARAALKMGARKVKIIYRRDKGHMPARTLEFEHAIKDGVEFIELVRIISANVENKRIVSLNCIKTELVHGKAVDIPGTEYIEPANTVIFAIGLKPNNELLEKEGVKLDDWGTIDVDINGKTNLDNVYAGGDVTETKLTVCRAVAAGKVAARGIIKKLL